MLTSSVLTTRRSPSRSLRACSIWACILRRKSASLSAASSSACIRSSPSIALLALSQADLRWREGQAEGVVEWFPAKTG